MLILLLLGMMSLAWMGVVAAVVFIEKVVAHGRTFGRAVGVALLVAGVVLMIWPQPLPSLT